MTKSPPRILLFLSWLVASVVTFTASAEARNPFLPYDLHRSPEAFIEHLASDKPLNKGYDRPTYFALLRKAGAAGETDEETLAYLASLPVGDCDPERFLGAGVYYATGTTGSAVFQRVPRRGERCFFDSLRLFMLTTYCGNPAVEGELKVTPSVKVGRGPLQHCLAPCAWQQQGVDQ